MEKVDIFLGENPIGLQEAAPVIFTDYAVKRDTPLSIMPHMENLLRDPNFQENVRGALGSASLIEIKIRGADRAVLVRNPNIPDSSFVEVKHPDALTVQTVSYKTQRAYQQFKAEQKKGESERSSPLSSRTIEPLPAPTRAPHFYEKRLAQLERDNRELKERLEELEAQQALERSKALLKTAQEGQGPKNTIPSDLPAAMKNLQQLVEKASARERTSREQLQLSTFFNLLFAAALSQTAQENDSLQWEIVELQDKLQYAALQAKVQGLLFEDLQSLVGAKTPVELLQKVRQLQEALQLIAQKTQSQLQGVAEQRAAAERKVRDLKSHTRLLEKQLQETKKKLAHAHARISAVSRNGRAVQGRMAKRLAAQDQTIKNLAAAQEKVEQLTVETAALHSELEKVTTNLRGARALASQMAQNEQSIRQQMETEIAQISGERNTLRTENQTMKSVLKAMQQKERRAETQLARAATKMRHLSQQIAALTKELAGAQEALTATKTCIAQVGENGAAVQKWMGEQIAELERSQEALAAQNQQLQQTLEGATKQQETSNQQRAVAEKTAQKLQQQVSELKQMLRQAEKTRVAEQREKENLAAQLQGTSSRIATLERQAAAQAAEITHKETEVARQQEQLQALQARLKAAEGHLEGEQLLTEDLRKEHEQLRAALKQKNRAAQRAQQEFDATSQRLKAAQEEISTLSEGLATLQEQLTAGEINRALLTAQLQKAQQDLSAATALEKRIAELTAQIKQVEKTRATEKRTQKQRIATLEKNLDGAEQALQTKADGNQQLQQEVSKLQNALRTEKESAAAKERQLEEKLVALQQELQQSEKKYASSVSLELMEGETKRLRDLLENIDSIVQENRAPQNLTDQFAEVGVGEDFEPLRTPPPLYASLPQKLQEAINHLKAKNNHIQEELETAAEQRETIDMLEQQLASWSEDFEWDDSDIAELHNPDTPPQPVVVPAEGLVEQLQDSLAEEKAYGKQLEDSLELLRQEANASDQQIDELQGRLKKQAKQLAAEKQTYREREEAIELLAEEQENKIQELQLQLQQLQRNKIKAEAEAEESRDGYELTILQAQRTEERLKKQLQAQKEEAAQLHQILQTTFCADRDLSIEEMEQSAKALHGRIEQLATDNASKTWKIEGLERNLEERTLQASELQEKNQALTIALKAFQVSENLGTGAPA